MEIVSRVQCPSVRGTSPNVRVFRRTRYFADKTSWLIRIPPTTPNRIVGRQQDIDCPASSTQLTINDRDMRARCKREFSSGWLQEIRLDLISRLSLSIKAEELSRILVHKNFEFPTNPRKRRLLAIKYSICEEWIYPHFVLKNHFNRAFLTSIFLRIYVKAHGRAHIRERPAFHWHSASRGEFHLYANLKPHFCTFLHSTLRSRRNVPDAVPRSVRNPERDERDESIFREATWAKNFRPLLSGGQIRRCNLRPK